jgi:hypothetical protein
VNAFAQLVLAWQGLRRSLRHLRSADVWMPWLIVVAVQVLVLACLTNFAHPAVSWFMAPLLRGAAGEDVLRYPNVFRLLPALYGRAGVAVSAVFGAVMSGAVLWIFARRFEGERAPAAAGLALALRRAPTLIVANLPATVLIAVALFAGEWLAAHAPGPRLLRPLARWAGLGGALVVQSAFLYVSAYIMLEGRGLVGAWRGIGPGVVRGFWAALLLSVALFLPHLPGSYLVGRVPALVERGTPELVAGLVVFEIAVGLVTSLLLAGGAALVFLGAVSERAEGLP